MDAFGWQTALVVFGVGMLLVLPLSLAIATARGSRSAHGAASQSLRQALSEAVGHRSTCCSCSASSPAASSSPSSPSTCRPTSSIAACRAVGGWTIAVIGLFNIVGSLASGWLGNLMPKRYILSLIYFARAAAVLAFISFR
jgi:hypothetical protein